MDLNNMIATGLNTAQACAYLLLIELGEITPPKLAKQNRITRTNAYKVLDSLVKIGLAKRKEIKNKYVYYPDSPFALSNLVAKQRNIAKSREDAVKSVMKDLLAKYHSHTNQPSTEVVTGRENVVNAYRQQIMQLEPIYFIRSQSDITTMGFDTMHEIRVMSARHGVKRYGITPDRGTTTPPQGDKRSSLERTWIRQEDYTAPVEWSVSGSSLLIVLFGAEPHSITITDPIIADAFRQLWLVLDTTLRAMHYYNTLPRLS